MNFYYLAYCIYLDIDIISEIDKHWNFSYLCNMQPFKKVWKEGEWQDRESMDTGQKKPKTKSDNGNWINNK